MKLEARHFQIVALSSLLFLGVSKLHFNVSIESFCAIFLAAIITQIVFSKIFGVEKIELKSAVITSLSLNILFKTNFLWLFVAASALAMASKFLIRIDKRHVFNPANFAIVIFLLIPDVAWVSPNQWGSKTTFAFFFIFLAGLVLFKAGRIDLALSFLLTYIGLLFLRAFYMGDPIEIPIKQMQSGSLLLFSFFMITDPKTTPLNTYTRILFGMLVAITGFVLQFQFYMPLGFFYALFFLSMLVPIINKLTLKKEQEVW